MNLINDGIGFLLALAPVAAAVALVLAGLALRREGSFLQGGRFGLWIFWAIVFLTVPQLLLWFSGFGLNVPISPGGGTAFLNVLRVDHLEGYPTAVPGRHRPDDHHPPL